MVATIEEFLPAKILIITATLMVEDICPLKIPRSVTLEGSGIPDGVVVEDICQRSVILNEGNLDTWIIEDGRRNRSTQILC